MVSTKPQEEPEPVQNNEEAVQAMASVEQEEATSPWGEFLRHRKRDNEYKHKFESNAIKSLISVTKAD